MSKPLIFKKGIDSAAAITQYYSRASSFNFHKFTILNGSILNKEQVLSAIVKQVQPNFLLPVQYELDGCNSCFLSSNCCNAIRALISNKLVVTIPELNLQVDVEIHMDCHVEKEMKVTPMSVILSAVKKRISVGDSVNVFVDVSNFQEDSAFDGEKGLMEVYFPLWVPHFQRIIVQTINNMLHLKHLNFSHNGITSLVELSRLHCPKLEELNLSYNHITWSDLVPIQPESLKSLWLTGNPLCSTPQSEYISVIKALYPNLQKLDGVELCPEGWSLMILRNYLPEVSSNRLADQFLHHYFSWFTRPDGRGPLVHMYHPKASISVTTNFLPTIDTSLSGYQFLSRNILRITNYARELDSFQSGSSHVSFILNSLPPLELDPSTTTVDIPYYFANKVMQVSVSGVMRDLAKKLYWVGFTFLLHATPESSLREWKITNQLISFTTATHQQAENAFLEGSVGELNQGSFDPSQEELLAQFEELTSMKTTWCQNFLKDTDWNFESALQSFVDQYKGDLVPAEAFLTA